MRRPVLARTGELDSERGGRADAGPVRPATRADEGAEAGTVVAEPGASAGADGKGRAGTATSATGPLAAEQGPAVKPGPAPRRRDAAAAGQRRTGGLQHDHEPWRCPRRPVFGWSRPRCSKSTG